MIELKNMIKFSKDAIRDAIKPRMTGGSSVPSTDFAVFPLLLGKEYEIGKRKVTSVQIAVVDSNMDLSTMSISNFYRSGRTSPQKSATADCQLMQLGFDGWNASHGVDEIAKHLRNKKITKTGKTTLYFPEFVDEKPNWENAEEKEVSTREAVEDAAFFKKAKAVFDSFVKSEKLQESVKLIDPEYK